MASHANGHANGRSPDGPALGPPSALAERPGAGDDKALNGDAFATAGEWLSARRRALRLTLEDIEASTRVREDYLAAIEDMDPRRMPAGPYAPGFVRTYAIHLELDPEAVTARFREEMSPRRLRTPQAARERTPIRISFPPRFWIPLLGAAVIAALFLMGRAPERESGDVLVPAVPEGLAEWVAADVQSRRTSAAPELVVGPDLALRARVPVWIEAVAPSGEVLISRTLEADETWVTPRIPGIVVSTDNGAAIEVLLDGRVTELMGDPGLPVTDWPADPARGLVAPPVEEVTAAAAPSAEGEAVQADDPAAAGAAGDAIEAETVEAAEDAEQILSDLAAEDALVTPDLPSQPEISVEALPPLIISREAYVPDPDETAAAEGRPPPPGPSAPDL